jgi:hypothetical protein
MYGEVEWPVRQLSVKFAGTCCKQFQFQFQLHDIEAKRNNEIQPDRYGCERPLYRFELARPLHAPVQQRGMPATG